MTGVNVEGVGAPVGRREVAIPVIASGGVASLDDLRGLQARKGVRIAGAILGRALYNGAIKPAEVIALAGRRAASSPC